MSNTGSCSLISMVNSWVYETIVTIIFTNKKALCFWYVYGKQKYCDFTMRNVYRAIYIERRVQVAEMHVRKT